MKHSIATRICDIAGQHISQAEDAGYGMYNYHINLSGMLAVDKYYNDGIVQVYPFKDSEHYGLVYLLRYFQDNERWDNECTCLTDLSKEEQAELYKLFAEQVIGYEGKNQ